MSDTTALVAPLMIPAHIPKIKTQTFKKENEDTKLIPSKPANIPKHDRINNNLYPYRSQIGPNNNDPHKIPIGKIENKVPAPISSSSNFDLRSVAIAPRVINPMPNNNNPKQAAQKTIVLLYILR